MSSWTHVSSLSNSFEFKLVLHLLFTPVGDVFWTLHHPRTYFLNSAKMKLTTEELLPVSTL